MTTIFEHATSQNNNMSVPVISLEQHPDFVANKERIEQNNTMINSAKYGWYSGVQDLFHFLQAIPGSLNEINDIIVSKTGVGAPSKDTIFKSVEEYLGKVSEYYDPWRRGHTPPLGKMNKVIANFASLPGIFGQYVPTTRLLGSLPLGFAVTDSLKAGYFGTKHDVPWAFAKGYALGGTVKYLSSFKTMPARISSLAALGFGITPGSIDDKVAAAITWGSFGLVPSVWGKSARPDAIKQKTAEVDVEIPVNKTLLQKHSDLVVELDKQLILRDRLSTKAEKSERNIIKIEELDFHIKDKQVAIESIQEALWWDQKISSKIATNEATNIEPEVARLDYFKPDGTPKYTDMGETQFKISLSNIFKKDKPVFTIGAKLRAHVLPLHFTAKYYAKDNPLLKRVESELRRWRILVDGMEEGILHTPVYQAAKFFRKSKLKNETTEQYNKRVPFSFAKYGLVLTAMRHGVSQPSMRGAITPLEALLRTNVNKAWKVIDAFTGAHDFKLKHAEASLIKNNKKVTPLAIGKEYLKKNKDGTFKYDMTDKELETNFKLDAEQTHAYKQLAWGLKEVLEMNNSRFKQMGASWKVIPAIPNYFPHMWMGNYRVFVNKVVKSENNKSSHVEVLRTDSALEAKRAVDMLTEKYKELETYDIKYEINEKVPTVSSILKSRQETDINLDVFSESIKALQKMDRMNEASILSEMYNTFAAKGTFSQHKLQRKNIKGWLGSKDALISEGVISRTLNIVLGERSQWRQLNEFATAYQSYIRGGVRNALNAELDLRVNRFLEGPTNNSSLTRYYPRWTHLAKTAVNNATGRFSGEKVSTVIDAATSAIIKTITLGKVTLTQRTLLDTLGGLNRATLAIKLLFGQARYLASSAIQPEQMLMSKLADLAGYSKKNNGIVAKSYAQAMYDLINPNKNTIELIKYGAEQKVLAPAFVKEFVPVGSTLVTNIKPFIVGSKVILDFNRMFDTLSLKQLATSFEQVSRLRGLLMFNRVLLNSTNKKGQPMYTTEQAKVLAARYADAYMVEYNRTERPWMYNRLGAVGKTAGLFKTFSHNWFAQFHEYLHQSKAYHNDAPLATFLYMHLLTAGIVGYVAKDEINFFIDKMQPILRKFNKGKRVPNLDEIFFTENRSNWVLYGVPSAILDADLTPTLRAPNFTLGELISFPAFEVLGLDPAGLISDDTEIFTKKGIIPSSFNLVWKTLQGTATISEWIAFHKAYAPTSMHGFIESYYSGRDINNILFEVINNKLGTELSETFIKSNYPELLDKKLPIRNSSKNVGILYRDDKDWLKRFFSTRSLREAKILKITAMLTKIKRSATFDKGTLVNVYAQYMLLDEAPPSWILKAYLSLGGEYSELQNGYRNRIKLLRSTYSEENYFDMLKNKDEKLYLGLIEKLGELHFSDLIAK